MSWYLAIGYTSELLADIKRLHETAGDCEITPQVAQDAELLLLSSIKRPKVSTKASGHVVAIAVGGDVNAPITINHSTQRPPLASKYPRNGIGADANMDRVYLFSTACFIIIKEPIAKLEKIVTPAKAGVQNVLKGLDSRLRGNDLPGVLQLVLRYAE